VDAGSLGVQVQAFAIGSGGVAGEFGPPVPPQDNKPNNTATPQTCSQVFARMVAPHVKNFF